MKIYKNLFLVLIFVLFSCDGFNEEIVPINISVEDIGQILVINGEIEENEIAWVQISYSEDIGASINTPIHYEKNASVSINTSNGTSEELVYGWDGVYFGNEIKGKVSETYTMTITIGSETYTAKSTMFSPPGYQGAWVYEIGSTDKGGGSSKYSDEWIINDPSATRNRYLFEWWANGVHYIRQDWAIDDNRVVNANEGLKLFTVTLDPLPNQHIRHRTAEIDKITYDYYNMYEKIVKGFVSVASQTPYNPVSNFGKGTIGNFRAVAFSSAILLTPPNISIFAQDEQNVLAFPPNPFFTKYNLYISTTSGVTNESTVMANLRLGVTDDEIAFHVDTNLTNGSTYYYRLEVEDAEGNVSILSPEVSASPDSNVPADTTSITLGNLPTNIVATPGNGEITISWTPAVGSKLVHGLYWSNQQGITLENISKDNEFWNIQSPYIHTGLDNSKTYYYRVSVYDFERKVEVRLSKEVRAKPN
ncbi:MAG: hypothetical protein ISR82_07320 [Candidatus Marinimicrobia bacterium]|nr:hypothetical protein [Candidatus Neomarinimicrobiota bacterium]MBL7011015.1 hypothetical protein [Candidatus Neomarinimicrobiota bacterium]MBL7031061.1 hypothetical protein [Candidatus Neomarinimicrobiota bacterium]